MFFENNTEVDEAQGDRDRDSEVILESDEVIEDQKQDIQESQNKSD